jgi:hypothetical protein
VVAQRVNGHFVEVMIALVQNEGRVATLESESAFMVAHHYPFGPVPPVFDRVYHLVPQPEVEPYSQRHTWRLL